MAIGDDFTVTVDGDIRHASGSTTYTVLELHRWLQQMADDASVATSGDNIDITSSTPSERSTDQIIELLNNYNIDDTAAEYFYGGSIKQTTSAGQEVYSGLKVLGAVKSSATYIMVIQNGDLYQYTTTDTAPFWGNQSGGGLNGDAAGGVLMRCLIKSRTAGFDINEQKARVQIRHYSGTDGDTFAYFDVTLGDGEAVAAVSSVDDPQNDTAQATVASYTHVTNTEGYQLIDLGDGSGDQPYYSKWTYGADTSGDQLKAVWEWAKSITRTGSTYAAHHDEYFSGAGFVEQFLGITHTYAYDGLTNTFNNNDLVAWGTIVTYNTLAGGTFSVGDYVVFGTSGARGRVVWDNGSTEMIVAKEDLTDTIVTTETITAWNLGSQDTQPTATGVTAAVNGAPSHNDKGGGYGLLLANDTTNSEHHIQMITGRAPVDNVEIREEYVASYAYCSVDTTITAQTVTPVFLGSYVGTLIGGFGVGIDPDDLTSSDTVIDLDGDTNTPPNNVTWTLSGVVSGDRVLVGPKDTGDAFKFTQMALAAALTTGSETVVDVGTGNIPANTPASGTLRVELDTGLYRYVEYDSHDGDDEFTLNASYQNWADPLDAAISNNVMISYVDAAASGTTIDFTTIYTSGPLDLRVRVRDGDEPIKTYEGNSQLTSTGGTAAASRISDA